MDANARNRVLLVGGALILIALLLVCGPLDGRFGEGTGVKEGPPVAATPPEPERSEAIDAAAAAAVAGGAAGGGASTLADGAGSGQPIHIRKPGAQLLAGGRPRRRDRLASGRMPVPRPETRRNQCSGRMRPVHGQRRSII